MKKRGGTVTDAELLDILRKYPEKGIKALIKQYGGLVALLLSYILPVLRRFCRIVDIYKMLFKNCAS